MGVDRFLREIGIVARLWHPLIVPLYDSGKANGLLFYVMPYETGPSVAAGSRRIEKKPDMSERTQRGFAAFKTI